MKWIALLAMACAPALAGAQQKHIGCANLAWQPAVVAFGGQSINTTSLPLNLTLTNTAQGVCLDDADLGAPTPTSSVFEVTRNTCGSYLSAFGQTACEIEVTFTPRAAGDVAATLRLGYSAFHGPDEVLEIPLTATGEKSPITHYYQSILRRRADAAGKAYWEGQAAHAAARGLDSAETWSVLAMVLFDQPEYRALARDDASYLMDLYRTFFNRFPDAPGISWWIGQLDGGMPREAVLSSFLLSAEYLAWQRSLLGGTAPAPLASLVTDFYRGMLARLPDDTGLAAWNAQVASVRCQGAGPLAEAAAAVMKGALESAEYQARGRSDAQFVADLYNAMLRRAADLGGIRHWTTALAAGTLTREQVRGAIAASPEFRSRMAAIAASQACPAA